MRSIILLASVAALSACTASAVPSFEDLSLAAYSGEGNIQRDGAACELEAEKARTMYNYGGIAGMAAYHESRNRAFDACMRMKGYRRRG